MNKRIREITGQVLDELVPETWTALGYDQIKEIQCRTAELIVAECLIVINQSNGVGDDDVIKISIDVREHFGVEE